MSDYIKNEKKYIDRYINDEKCLCSSTEKNIEKAIGYSKNFNSGIKLLSTKDRNLYENFKEWNFVSRIKINIDFDLMIYLKQNTLDNILINLFKKNVKPEEEIVIKEEFEKFNPFLKPIIYKYFCEFMEKNKFTYKNDHWESKSDKLIENITDDFNKYINDIYKINLSTVGIRKKLKDIYQSFRINKTFKKSKSKLKNVYKILNKIYDMDDFMKKYDLTYFIPYTCLCGHHITQYFIIKHFNDEQLAIGSHCIEKIKKYHLISGDLCKYKKKEQNKNDKTIYLIIKTYIKIYDDKVVMRLWLIEKEKYLGKLKKKKNNINSTEEEVTTKLYDYDEILKYNDIKIIEVNDINEIILEDVKLLQNEQQKIENIKVDKIDESVVIDLVQKYKNYYFYHYREYNITEKEFNFANNITRIIVKNKINSNYNFKEVLKLTIINLKIKHMNENPDKSFNKTILSSMIYDLFFELIKIPNNNQKKYNLSIRKFIDENEFIQRIICFKFNIAYKKKKENETLEDIKWFRWYCDSDWGSKKIYEEEYICNEHFVIKKEHFKFKCSNCGIQACTFFKKKSNFCNLCGRKKNENKDKYKNYIKCSKWICEEKIKSIFRKKKKHENVDYMFEKQCWDDFYDKIMKF